MSDQLPQDFAGWWAVPGEWVEAPNERRNGWSGMMRYRIGDTVYYVKKQHNHLYHSWRHPLGWPTTDREYANLRRLQALGIGAPEAVFNGVQRNADGLDGVLVTKELQGYTDLAAQQGLSAEQRRVLAQTVGALVGRMHRAHLQHSCLYDKHIMVRWAGETPEVALIDLEKLRIPYLPWRAARHDLDQLRRHQRLWDEEEWAILLAAHAAAK